MKTESFSEKMDRFDKLLSSLNSDIVCGISVGALMLDSPLYEPAPIGKNGGKYAGRRVTINENIGYDDFRVFDNKKNELLNLTKFGFIQ